MNPYLQYMYSYPHKTAYRPLKGVALETYAPLLRGGGHGLYLHIPFCQSKCGYCNLFSVTGQNAQMMNSYLQAMKRQIKQYRALLSPYQTAFSEVVVGGGTPLLLPYGQLSRLFEVIEKYMTLEEGRQIIVETAPNQTEKEKLRILQKAGVTRISMGVQSFSDQDLLVLGRQHNAKKAREALDLIKRWQFSCVNLDFIYGIPGQTIEGLLASLKEAVRYEPDEIFLYPLYVKHGVRMEKKLREGMVLDPKKTLLQYREASAFLKGEGYRQDSMRRFVKAERARDYTECGMGTSLALGCGGRSYLGNLHFCTPYETRREACLKQLKAYIDTTDFRVITHGILLNQEEQKRRWVIRHLLIYPGLEIGSYLEQFGSNVMVDFPMLKEWKDQGYLLTVEKESKIFLALTERGLELSDYLGPQLISSEVRKLMEEWETVHGRTNGSLSGKPKEL